MTARTHVTKWDLIATGIGLTGTAGVLAGCHYQLWPVQFISGLVLATTVVLVVWYQIGDER